jgi:hypothetical protein
MRALRMGVFAIVALQLGILLLAQSSDSTRQDPAAQSSPQTPAPQSSPGTANAIPVDIVIGNFHAEGLMIE